MFQLILQEATDLKNKFATPRRSFIEDSASTEVDDLDIIPNEEMLLVRNVCIHVCFWYFFFFFCITTIHLTECMAPEDS